MSRHPAFGLFLALFGALAITPDTLFMRWSRMDGMQMVAWRGLLMGAVFIAVWLVLHRRTWRTDLRNLRSAAGLTVIFCQFLGAILFSVGIAEAPVAVVLLGAATVPVFSAIFAFLLMGERTHWPTWAATIAVIGGIVIAVFGSEAGAATTAGSPLLGAVLGLAVAISMALHFISIRHNPAVPIPLAIGCGALLAGIAALATIGPTAALQGNVMAIAVTGIVILPVSFFALALSARHTHAVNVSLVMLVETVLGPFWVWLGTGQRPTQAMMVGGAIVVSSLALYLSYSGRRLSGKKPERAE